MPLYPSTQVSPAFSGDPTAPTPTAGDDDTSVATTEFVTDAVATQAGTDAATYASAGYRLTGTPPTDLTVLLNAVVAAGNTHITIPAGTWPQLTKFTGTGLRIDFEPGAKVSLNYSGTSGWDLTNCTVTDGYWTSPYTGPTSGADGTANYGYPSREILLRDNCHLRGECYVEYATSGFHFVGTHCTFDRLRAKGIRHRTGWGNAVHFDGTVAGGGWDISGNRVHAEDCDRMCETEDGAHDVVIRGGGYGKNIYPNGYTGQPTDASGPDGSAYATYTFVLDAHGHQGGGGVQNIIYDGDWFLDNCGTAVTFIRSTGTNDSDLPRNCRAGNIHIRGRGFVTGYETIAIQGHNNRVGNVFMELGSGISSSTLFRARIYSGESNTIGDVRAEAFSLPLLQIDSGASGTRVGTIVPTDAVQNGSGYLVDVAGPRTVITGLAPQGVGGTSGYLRFQSTATGSRAKNFEYTLKAGENFATPVVMSATGVTVNDGPIIAKNTGSGRFFRPCGPGTTGTNNTLGNGTLRLYPFELKNAITFDQIGGEITSGGDAGCVLRLGIYSDAQGIPGNPLVDTTIPGDAIAIAMSTVTAVTLQPGWYWVGGAVQGVTTTQPTVRSMTSPGEQNYPILCQTTTLASQSNHYGQTKGSVTGALPAFGTTASSTSVAPLVILRLA